MDRTIDEEIVIEVPPERLFEAWTEARHMTAWWGQENEFRTIGFVRDLCVGGLWRAEFEDVKGNRFGAGGTYLRVERPNWLSFTWKPDWTEQPATTIEMEFRKMPAGSLLKFRQHGFVSDQALAENKAAWGPTIDWLRCYVTSKPKA